MSEAQRRSTWPSIGRRTAPLVERLIEDADLLRLKVTRSSAGAVLVDAGIDCVGGIEAGRRIAEICMGGAGWVSVAANPTLEHWTFSVNVTTGQPVLACLASQYAGWQLSHGDGADGYFAMASGPGRARAAREQIFKELAYEDDAPVACFVLEAASLPPDGLIAEVAEAARLPASDLTFVVTPTTSLAGTVQIVSRVLEVALHKVHTLHFPLTRVLDGTGCAPLPPPAADFLTAMGRTNDAVMFGGQVHLFVSGHDAEAEALAKALPATSSSSYGKPFKELFEDAGGDFYKIDGMLFSPARVLVTAVESGRSFKGGHLAPELMARSFGEPG